MTRSSLVVVDASVSLKWVLDDEECVQEAVALRNDALHGQLTMVAPSLWSYEVSNGLSSAVRRHRLSVELGVAMLTGLLALNVRMIDPDPEDVYWQAVRCGIASYDAAYLALAKALAVPLWTGDRRLYATIGHVDETVHWIGTYL